MLSKIPTNGPGLAKPGATSEVILKHGGRIGIITNPNARCSQTFAPKGVAREETTRHAAELPGALDRLLAGGIDFLAVNGGDGTLGAVVSQLAARKLSALPLLVPVLGGTNNAVAKDAGAVGRLDAVLTRVRAALARPTRLATVTRKSLRVALAGGETRHGFIFTAGLIVRFADAYYAGPWVGSPQVVRIVVEKLAKVLWPSARHRAFWRFEPFGIGLDGVPLNLPHGVQVVYASTIDTQLLFFRPFPQRSSQVAGFHALINAMDGPEIARRFFPLVLGRFQGPSHVCRETHTLELAGATRIFLDGELFDVDPGDPLTVTVGPPLTFLKL